MPMHHSVLFEYFDIVASWMIHYTARLLFKNSEHVGKTEVWRIEPNSRYADSTRVAKSKNCVR